jgi:hypothetical protein
MTLVLPDDLAAFESNLSAAQLDQIASDLRAERQRLVDDVDNGAKSSCGTYPYSLNLYMPRFGLETRAELRKALATLGMPAAFDPGRADFTGIHKPEFDGDSVFIANVIHQANIDGRRAGYRGRCARRRSAWTRLGAAALPPPRSARSDSIGRSSFALRDVETGAVLFLGRVVDLEPGELSRRVRRRRASSWPA